MENNNRPFRGPRRDNFRRNNNRNSNSRGRNRQKESKINISRFIKKVDTLKEQEIYTPENHFQDFKIDENLKRNIISKGYTTPTPIQDQSINHILEGKDLLGIANTGTGKTAAFLIPLINKMLLDRTQKALIIAPTRELAIQIDEELYSFTKGLNIRSVVCVGGVNINPQLNKLRGNYSFVIGTPGRLKDLNQRKALKLDGFANIVLDEVDRMLDMGFITDIKYLISKLAQERHSLFFSATTTPEIEKLISSFLKDYTKVSVKTGETTDNVDQDVVKYSGMEDKFNKLKEILDHELSHKSIIFVKTKHGVERLGDALYHAGFKVDSIHGNKSQGARKKALDNFRAGRVNILVATDVAARGLDIPKVSHVINFDVPATYEDYVHRIGRTGRANQIGNALTFVEEKGR